MADTTEHMKSSQAAMDSIDARMRTCHAQLYVLMQAYHVSLHGV